MDAFKPGDPIPITFRDWHRDDAEAADKWRREIYEPATKAVAGDQWSGAVRKALAEQMRPAMTFNRIAPVIDAVSGQQIANRQELRFLPREQGDVKVNELLTGAAEWFSDVSEGEDENSEAFLDCVIAGMGWSDTRLDYEDDDEGAPCIERLCPDEMLWDANAKRGNLADARRLWRVRTIPLEVAQEMFPGKTRFELDASWARGDGGEQPYVADEPRDRMAGRGGGHGRPNEVTLVQVQWIERKPIMLAADPLTGDTAEFEPRDYEKTAKRFKQLGMNFPATRRMRKVRKQAFLGGVVLDVTDAPCPEHFSWQCVTGKRDPQKGYWYGLVRAMIEPQEWANKWLSQMLQIMNTTAKGGVMVEESAVAGGLEQLEDTWARNDAVTVFADGALSAGRVSPKPVTPIPPQLMQLTEFAISSIRDVSGVNLEMLGMREANQPGVLEYQRREAGMTVLQWLFDAFRRYRRAQGKVILYYLQHDMSDGRLVRISGEEGEQYVPLVSQADVEYDIIVDEAPTAPNQKERTWELITAILPGVRDMLTPQVMLELLAYSPLPSSIVEKLRGMAEAAQQSPEAMQQQEMAVRAAAAEVGEKEANAFRDQMAGQLDQAKRAEIEAEIGNIIAETMHKRVQTANEASFPPQMARAMGPQQNQTPA